MKVKGVLVLCVGLLLMIGRGWCAEEIIRLTRVETAELVYYPVAHATQATPAVIICPGGGYQVLAWDLEGTEVAQFLQSSGVAGVILKYRVPNQRAGALEDALMAVREVRRQAAKYQIDPRRIGMMGFSAGANLTVRTATNYPDAASRPDFQIVVYPWDLIGKESEWQVTTNTPPAFIVQSKDDFAKVETAYAYAKALKAVQVPVELHIYERGGYGGHGYGIRKLNAPTDGWHAKALQWIQQNTSE